MHEQTTRSLNTAASVRLPTRVRHDLKVKLRHLIKQRPTLYLWISRLRHNTGPSRHPADILPEVVGKKTEIVIEAPARSGNTFAVLAFKMAQSRPIFVAHHLHAAAQVITAAKLNIPAMVLLRNPEDVVLSRVATHPPITMKQALTEYVDFFNGVLPYRQNIVVVPFERVISNFGSITADVNRRFGTRFVEFCHTEGNVQRVFDLIAERQWLPGVPEGRLARPSKERMAIKEALRNEYCSPSLRDSRERAQDVHTALMSHCVHNAC